MSFARFDPAIAAKFISYQPALFQRDTAFAAKTVSVAADRLTLVPPTALAVQVEQRGYYGQAANLVLSDAAAWDSTATDYTIAANRAGKNFYFYAVVWCGIVPRLLLSANATYPTGYTAANSRKLGGFHCLCADVRHDLSLTAWAASTAIAAGVTRRATTWDGRLYRCYTAGTTAATEPTWGSYPVGSKITDGTVVWEVEQHALEGYEAGDILPASVWDLLHRPVCAPKGMVYVSGIGRWVDIYLSSVSGGALVSAYGGTIADGISTPAFHWYKFSQWFGQIGKRLLTQTEFVAASLGSNQGTNIAGSADPVTTGWHSDTSGRRMISNVGCEDCCGAMWQWGAEAGGGASPTTFASASDSNDSGVAGQSYEAPNCALVGGDWHNGAICGSRGSYWGSGPLILNTYYGARGVAESLAVAL